MHPIDEFDDETLRCRTTGFLGFVGFRDSMLFGTQLFFGDSHYRQHAHLHPRYFSTAGRKSFHGRWPNKSRHHIETISQLHWNERRREIRHEIKPRKTSSVSAIRCREMEQRCSPDMLEGCITSNSGFWGYRHFHFSPCMALSSHYEKLREDVRVCKLY
jgi:hypothetical protein